MKKIQELLLSIFVKQRINAKHYVGKTCLTFFVKVFEFEQNKIQYKVYL